MYNVGVREHLMVAHSLRGAVFGPAQRLHGATYVVDLELKRAALDAHGLVADIGRVGELLRRVLAEWNYRNLDDETAFAGRNTTTEFLAQAIFERVAAAIAAGDLGPGSEGLCAMQIKLHESHVAWAGYEGVLPSPGA